MSLPEWPTELPRPMRSSFSIGRAASRLRKAADTGPPGYRRRFSAVPRPVQLQIDVTRADRAVFERFYEEVTGEGSLPFWMPDPTTEGWALLTDEGAPILDGAGAPLLIAARWLVLFGESTPAISPRGVRFTIDFSVTVMP